MQPGYFYTITAFLLFFISPVKQSSTVSEISDGEKKLVILSSQNNMPGINTNAAKNEFFKLRSKQDLLFIENKGQVTDVLGNTQEDILFTAENGETEIYVKPTGIYYKQNKIAGQENQAHQVAIELKNSNPAPTIRKEEQDIYTTNYYLPHAPGGITGVRSFRKIVLENVYDGIDWVIYNNGSFLEHDFVVKPGIDPSIIRFVINGADDVSISANGELLIATRLGYIKEDAPVSFSNGDTVTTKYHSYKDDSFGFDLASYNTGEELVIDPSVIWSTYYGGEAGDHANSVVADAAGNIYVTGHTLSNSGIATTGGFQETRSVANDAFLLKFNANGQRLWATYYGGTSEDRALACMVDGAGNAYITGFTRSTTVIGSGGFQNTYGGGQQLGDAFLAKFASNGTRVWGTYYGGPLDDIARGGAIDASGNIYINGYATSTTAIASGGHQNINAGSQDAFLAKFNAAGNRLWATYYGGSNGDDAFACATDTDNNVYLAGNTSSTTGISFNGFQNARASSTDAFLVKFNSAGTRLWGTYYGGLQTDHSYGCVAGNDGSVYLAGYTQSTSGIASAGHQMTVNGVNDAFVVRFNAAGNRLWGTYFGGEGNEFLYSICRSNDASIYIVGSSASNTGIDMQGFQPIRGGMLDGFIAKFNENGSMRWSGYFGGPGNDNPMSVCSDATGNIYLAGNTLSTTGIASGTNVHQPAIGSTAGGNSDAFITKIDGADPLPMKLLSFQATLAGLSANLKWTTSNELNLDYFEVQRSANTVNFVTVGKVFAVNPTATAEYQHTDLIPSGGINTYQYRLKCVKDNGDSTFSKKIEVMLSETGMISVFPNPAHDKISVRLHNASEPSVVRIINLNGQVLFNKSFTTGFFEIPVNMLSTGMYILEAKTSSGTFAKRFIKK